MELLQVIGKVYTVIICWQVITIECGLNLRDCTLIIHCYTRHDSQLRDQLRLSNKRELYHLCRTATYGMVLVRYTTCLRDATRFTLLLCICLRSLEMRAYHAILVRTLGVIMLHICIWAVERSMQLYGNNLYFRD